MAKQKKEEYLLNNREVNILDKKALYNLSYGVFMLSTKWGDVVNGCITNTCMQVANNPALIAISVLNTNYTCELIKKSKGFAVTVLSEDCSYETIEHFGMQSGRDVDKFAGLEAPLDVDGIPYLEYDSCSVISATVVQECDLGSHTLFIAEVGDAVLLNDKAPLTYADYQRRIKPKAQAVDTNKKVIGWMCKICDYVYEGSVLPDDFTCPTCGHGKDDFVPIYE